MVSRLASTAVALLLSTSAEAVTLEPGDIVVADALYDSVYHVDPATGDRTVVSSDSIGAGPSLGQLFGIAVEPSGTILVTGTADFVTGWVYRIDPLTGDRSVVTSSVVGSGPNLVNPMDLVIGPDGSIFVI